MPILRCRSHLKDFEDLFFTAGFMKFARRKLHKEYKYSSDASLTFRQWLSDHIPLVISILITLDASHREMVSAGILLKTGLDVFDFDSVLDSVLKNTININYIKN